MREPFSYIEHLKRVIPERYWTCASARDHVRITEESQNNRYDIIISHFQGPLRKRLVVRYDDALKERGNSIVSPIFSTTTTHPHNRICDAVIFDEETEGVLKVLLLELKSGGTEGAVSQIRSSKCLTDFLLNSIREFNNGGYTDIHFKSAILRQAKELPTSPKRAAGQNYKEPNTIMFISGREFNYRHFQL